MHCMRGKRGRVENPSPTRLKDTYASDFAGGGWSEKKGGSLRHIGGVAVFEIPLFVHVLGTGPLLASQPERVFRERVFCIHANMVAIYSFSRG